VLNEGKIRVKCPIEGVGGQRSTTASFSRRLATLLHRKSHSVRDGMLLEPSTSKHRLVDGSPLPVLAPGKALDPALACRVFAKTSSAMFLTNSGDFTPLKFSSGNLPNLQFKEQITVCSPRRVPLLGEHFTTKAVPLPHQCGSLPAGIGDNSERDRYSAANL
jgi:hypothetical protein